MSSRWISLVAILCCGCITGEEPVPNTEDSLVGVSQFDAAVPTGDGRVLPPMDTGQGLPPRLDIGVGGCAPGTRLGLCSVCGPNGQPQVADDDNQCPPVDCGMGGYERVLEGDDVVCYQTTGAPAQMGRCADMNRCKNQMEFCGQPQRMEIARGPVDPCHVMVGCQGAQAPMFQDLDLGTPCNRIGICRASGMGGSECTVQVPSHCRLDEAIDAKFFCEAGQDPQNNLGFCEYFVEPPNDGRVRCIDFCQGLGFTVCDQAQGEQCCWNNATDTNCERAGGLVCDGTPCDDPQGCQNQICRCYLPAN